MVTESLIRIRRKQRLVDLLPREYPAVGVAIGMQRIIRGSLIPERDESCCAINVNEIRVKKIQAEVERSDNASTTAIAVSRATWYWNELLAVIMKNAQRPSG